MHDRPTAAELIDAVRGYLEKELLPALTDARLRFQTLIAANVLAIAGRELAAESVHEVEEWQMLDRLLGDEASPPDHNQRRTAIEQRNQLLCQRIRDGVFDESARARELMALLRQQVMRKLEVANPRYLEVSKEPRTK